MALLNQAVNQFIPGPIKLRSCVIQKVSVNFQLKQDRVSITASDIALELDVQPLTFLAAHSAPTP